RPSILRAIFRARDEADSRPASLTRKDGRKNRFEAGWKRSKRNWIGGTRRRMPANGGMLLKGRADAIWHLCCDWPRNWPIAKPQSLVLSKPMSDPIRITFRRFSITSITVL